MHRRTLLSAAGATALASTPILAQDTLRTQDRWVQTQQYKLRYELSDFFRMFGKTETPAIKVDLGMEGLKVEPGHLYFLSPMALH